MIYLDIFAIKASPLSPKTAHLYLVALTAYNILKNVKSL